MWGIFPIYRVWFPNLHSYFRNNICFSLLKIIHLWNNFCFSLSRIILLRDNICISLLRIILLWNKICFFLLRIILLRDNICFSLLRIILPNNVRTNFVRLISGHRPRNVNLQKVQSGDGGPAASQMIKSTIWRGRRRRLR